jgi:hypothetical protein
MHRVRGVSLAAAHYGRFDRQFDRPVPVRVMTRSQPDNAGAKGTTRTVTGRRDSPHLGRLLDIYV